MSDSLRAQGMYPASLLCPWNSPGTDAGGGRHFLLDQGLNLGLLHCRQILHSLSHQGPLWFSKSSFYSLGSLVS